MADESTDRVLGTYPRKEGKELRIALNEFKGYKYLHFRHYQDLNGKMLPTKEGVTFRANEMGSLLQAVELAALDMKEGGAQQARLETKRTPPPIEKQIPDDDIPF